MRVAIDHDGTLAETTSVALDLIHGDDHEYGNGDVESWEWGLEEFGQHRYLSALWHAWTIRPLQVPVLDETAQEAIQELREDHLACVLTACPDHPGLAEGKQEWLDHHGFEYDNFIMVDPGVTKAKYVFDAFIDDKPYLPVQVNEERPKADMYLIDQPYNQDADGDYVRVENVKEAVDDILGK